MTHKEQSDADTSGQLGPKRRVWEGSPTSKFSQTGREAGLVKIASVATEALLANFVLNSVQTWLYRKNSYTEFFARAQFIKDFLSRIRYNFSKPGSVSDAKMLRIPLIFGITFFFWTIKGTACQISSFMYHFRPYSLFKVSSSSTL